MTILSGVYNVARTDTEVLGGTESLDPKARRNGSFPIIYKMANE